MKVLARCLDVLAFVENEKYFEIKFDKIQATQFCSNIAQEISVPFLAYLQFRSIKITRPLEQAASNKQFRRIYCCIRNFENEKQKKKVEVEIR